MFSFSSIFCALLAAMLNTSADVLTLTGVVQRTNPRSFVLELDQERKYIHTRKWQKVPAPGTRVAVTAKPNIPAHVFTGLNAQTITVLGEGAITPPRPYRLADLDPLTDHLRAVEVEGTIIDVLPDEIDSRYDILLLKDKACRLPLFVPAAATNKTFIGTTIHVSGYYHGINWSRRFAGPYLHCPAAANITIITRPQISTEAPLLDLNTYLTAANVLAMGQRAVIGEVLATWGDDNLMLRVDSRIVNGSLTLPAALPPIGSTIKLIGYPYTDLYRINFVKATWQAAAGSCTNRNENIVTDLNKIVHRTPDQTIYKYIYHGQLLRLRGTVKALTFPGLARSRLDVEIEGHRTPVDASRCPDIVESVSPGCVIEVTGRCLMEVDARRPYDPFPHISGFAIILRAADDITIIHPAPWWTPNRLMLLSLTLGALLLAVVVWTFLLTRLAEHRGRALFRTEIARANETLRVEERTRLAVELHDSLSQNLTGVALQLKAGRHELAIRALKSCRDELRNCLWDLRNNAIDCDHLDEAIRQTLEPHIENIELKVRFNVPRTALSDNTAYSILRIIRELVVNAIRHGGATKVRIAGGLEPERLLFSVQDDGCGFDPQNHPGITEGHFGLQGIAERVAALDGKLTINSSPGAGTKITIILPVIRPSISKVNT